MRLPPVAPPHLHGSPLPWGGQRPDVFHRVRSSCYRAGDRKPRPYKSESGSSVSQYGTVAKRGQYGFVIERVPPPWAARGATHHWIVPTPHRPPRRPNVEWQPIGGLRVVVAVRLLRLCPNRPRRRTGKSRDELTSLHSITSSARAKSPPSAQFVSKKLQRDSARTYHCTARSPDCWSHVAMPVLGELHHRYFRA